MLKTVVVFVVAIVFVFLRTVFKESEHVISIVACINVIALVYVIMSVVLEINRAKNKADNGSILPSETQIHRKKNRIAIIIVISLVVSFFSISYFIKWASSLFNDILSITALCLALTTDGITSYFGNGNNSFFEN